MTSDEWDRRYAGTELLWSAGPNRLFALEVADLPPGRALDLACGEGRTAVWLAERGWDVTAVDFSGVALEKARRVSERRGVTLPSLVHADLLDYRPSERAFDLVAVLYLQLPAGDLRTVLTRAAAAVDRGGTFLLIAHDLANLTQGHGGPRDATVLTTADAVVAALPGLDIVRAEPVLRDVEGAERPAVDVIVRATAPG